MGTQTVNREINGLGIGALTISTNSLTTDRVTLGEEHLSFLQSQSQVTEAVRFLTKKAKVEMRGLLLTEWYGELTPAQNRSFIWI